MEINIGKKFTFGILGPKQNVVGRCFIGIEGQRHFVGIHIFPRFDPNYTDEWWGLTESWYDGPLYSFGVGPLFCIVWG